MGHDDALWLAGLLEGEGSFFTYGAGRPCACVQVHMTDADVIDRAAVLMGCSRVTVRRNNAKPHWKQTYQARVAGGKAAAVMYAVLPHMGQRRSARIRGILALELSHHPRGAQ